MNNLFLSRSDRETRKVAKEIASAIKPQKEGAFVIYLSGDLGSGKTTFVKGFLSTFGIKNRIVSPTFNIFKRYSIKKIKFKNIYHFDCYRIKNGKELDILGFKEIINNPLNIVLIEWPENIGRRARPSLRISFKYLPEKDSRSIRFSRARLS
ncbi:MAG: tRNA (adenosine(37)-N6)-threonylcarbamoyltransferase complex ATPase subunit type 1 TsaE [Candidatus Colwellbacteria bacterium]|nr:tRNA (adenosine(37)-N6)-threonylcarbamoyltransferase complex ATPase subunit type 1 TsaE [Candidatus Colwellbacteria bacterium]